MTTPLLLRHISILLMIFSFSLPVWAFEDDEPICPYEVEEGAYYLVEDCIMPENIDVPGDLYVRSDAKLDLAGNTLTVNGDLILEEGSLLLHQGMLIVNNNFRIQSKLPSISEEDEERFGDSRAILVMNDALDTIYVLGDFYMQSQLVSTLEQGVLSIDGSFYQYRGVEDNFAAVNQHKVILNGDKEQDVYFDSYDAEVNSHFALLEIGHCNITFLDDQDNDYGFKQLKLTVCEGEDLEDESVSGDGEVDSDTDGSDDDINCDDGAGANCPADDEDDLIGWDWQLTENSFTCVDEDLLGCVGDAEASLVYDNNSRWQPKKIHRLGNDYRIVSDNRDLLIDFADDILTKALLATKGSEDKEVLTLDKEVLLTLDFESHAYNKTAQASFDLDAVSWSMNIHDVKSDYQVRLAGSMGGTLFGLSNMLVSGEQIILDFKLLPGLELRTQAVLQFTEQGVELRVYKQAIGSSQYLFVQGTVLPNHSEIIFSGRNVNIKTTFSTKQSVDDVDKNKIDKLKVAKE